MLKRVGLVRIKGRERTGFFTKRGTKDSLEGSSHATPSLGQKKGAQNFWGTVEKNLFMVF